MTYSTFRRRNFLGLPYTTPPPLTLCMDISETIVKDYYSIYVPLDLIFVFKKNYAVY